MQLNYKRTVRTDNSTIGELSIDGKFECFILEDKDRGLKDSMLLNEINKTKIHSKTAIPSGKYEIVITFSNRFQKYLPLLLNVKGFAGIRIHSGNTSTDTEGCLIVGQIQAKDKVLNSALAFKGLFAKLKAVEKKEKIFITIA